MSIRRRVIVHGLVQGVGFRYFAQLEAARLGVTGYARNRMNGTVEVEVEGPESAVDGMLGWLSAGPPSAEVDSLQVTAVPTQGDTGFAITR